MQIEISPIPQLVPRLTLEQQASSRRCPDEQLDVFGGKSCERDRGASPVVAFEVGDIEATREGVCLLSRPEAASGGAASFNPFRSLARRTKLLFERCLVPA